MIERLRRRGSYRNVAIALIAFISTGPSYAEPFEDSAFLPPPSERVEDLQAVVADLEDPVLRDFYEQLAVGEASYYGHELAGNRTASGERFDPRALTAAHRSLPLGTRLRVTNMANGMSVIVRINDRGPFVGNRIIDVSLAAARQISMVRSGKAQVKLEILRSIS